MGQFRIKEFSIVVAVIFFCFAANSEEVDFNRDIRAILSDNCIQCHGPDESSREADLRLDIRENAVADLGGYAAIVPGKSSKSEIIARILSDDPNEVMPPPKTKKHLAEAQIETLKTWIDQGAEYQEHWSFLPLSQSEAPAETGWGKNPVDQWVGAALKARGIKPSAEANSYTLIRRLYIDLIGLLPESDAIEKFVAAHAENPDAAVSKLADELLASDHYGERWGRHWLDQARYADSNGYTIDGERTMWPYRDWVIRALNEDVPFDRFTIEQLAGDLLPNPSRAQLVASGFHRNTLINQEGGTDDEQFRNEEVVDRVNTTGAVWLGLTLGCAQCHSHKFDPISQKEYFEMFAFFNSGLDVNNAGKTLEVSEGEMFLDNPDPAKLKALEDAKSALATVEKSRSKRQELWEKEMLTAESGKAAVTKWRPLKPVKYLSADGAILTKLEDDSILSAKGGPREIYSVTYEAPKQPVAAVRLRVLPHKSLPKNGPGAAGNGNFVLTRVDIRHGGKDVAIASAQHDHAQPNFSSGYLIDGNPEKGWAINVGKGSAPGAKMNAPHEAHFTLADKIPADGKSLEVILHHEKNNYYNIGRFAVDVSTTPPATLSAEKLLTTLMVDPKKRSSEQKKFLIAEFNKVDVEKRNASKAVIAAKKALGFGSAAKTMIMQELSKPRETYIHERGDFLRLDKATGPLQPGVPAVFPGLPSEVKKPNRLDLAHWLMRDDHPLTARVTVNRVWMRYFGKGLVETENDFGTQGAFPSHPGLLDWLARRFMADGWSMKKLHKLIVTSATYRQSSNLRKDISDPLNQMLARQSRIRFDAEIVRDAALTASGLISRKIGGPGVTPPQPEGVYSFTQRKVNWVAAKGAQRYRRAMYTKFIRAAPYPLLTTFDSPDFQSVCTSRVRSNTPLQSLTMANDASIFELAQGLGSRMMRDIGGTDSVANRDRIRHGFALCLSRIPDDDEVEAVAYFQEQQVSKFEKDPEAAEEVAPAEYPESDFDVAVAAAWTSVARALMNTDEFITRE